MVQKAVADSSFLSQIVGLDMCESDRPEKQALAIVAHINAIRKIRGLETSRIVFCPESNYAHEGTRIAKDIADARVPMVFCMEEGKKGKEGILMTNSFKKEMWMMFNRLLIKRAVRFHPHMVCISKEKNTPESMRKLLITQLRSYSREIRANKTNTNAPSREIFSGKHAGPDDHCVAVQICYKSMEMWQNNIAYYNSKKPLYTTSYLS
jgi:hypothetical protein